MKKKRKEKNEKPCLSSNNAIDARQFLFRNSILLYKITTFVIQNRNNTEHRVSSTHKSIVNLKTQLQRQFNASKNNTCVTMYMGGKEKKTKKRTKTIMYRMAM